MRCCPSGTSAVLRRSTAPPFVWSLPMVGFWMSETKGVLNIDGFRGMKKHRKVFSPFSMDASVLRAKHPAAGPAVCVADQCCIVSTSDCRVLGVQNYGCDMVLVSTGDGRLRVLDTLYCINVIQHSVVVLHSHGSVAAVMPGACMWPAPGTPHAAFHPVRYLFNL